MINFNHQATYWGKSSVDEFNQVTYSTPKSINVRWEEKREMFADKEGREIRSNSIVYALEDLELEGYLFLGSSTAVDPRLFDNTYEIKMKSNISNLKNTKQTRKIWL